MIVVVVDRLPADPVSRSVQVVPLHAGVQHLENMIEDFVGGDFRVGTARSHQQVRLNVPVEVCPAYLFGQLVVQWGRPLRLFVWLVCFHGKALKIKEHKHRMCLCS